jgi:D-alanyl-D-alanine carboxypeptidase
MNRFAPVQPARRRAPRLVLLGAAIVVTAFVTTLGHPTVSSSTTPFGEVLHLGHHGGLGEADGVLRDDASVFDDTPAVARLDPGLRSALRRAADEAARDGVVLHVNSGWRSPAYQERLLQQAIATYGSRAEAARWVATPRTSSHVSGDAVDVGHSDATRWLAEHGAEHGLCPVYGNEPWHYELRPDAVQHGCPATYADPTHDPRMRG